MFKLIRNLLLVSPAIAGVALSYQASAVAQTSVDDMQLLDEVNRYGSEGRSNSVNQVTNVNQLRDVQPTDWAYEALRSLVDRYGCIAGYPNQTYRGSQALTRYEFAAGLNSCLNQIERLIASSEAVTREDLDTMSRLSQEFEAELATLGGRIDNIESRTAFLEDNQFSTTTKLEGEVAFGISNEFNYDNQTVFQDRVRLAFVSSFTGEDALYARLDASNAVNFDGIDTGVLTYQTGPATRDDAGGIADSNNIGIGWLAYYFPVGDKIDVYLPAAFPLWVDFVPSLSPYLDSFTGATGSLSSFAESSPIYKIGLAGGGGLGLNFTPTEFITVSGGYFADTSFDPSDSNGLLNGGYSALGQVTLSALDDRLQVAGTYVRGYFTDDDPQIFDLGIGTAAGATPFAEATTSNSYGVEAAFQFNERIAFNAFGVYTDATALDTDDDADIWSYGAGIAFPDFGKEGNLAAVFAGAEPYGETEDVPIHLEGFYKYQLNDNISVTPGVVYILSPNGDSDEDDAIIGVLRTTFTF